MHNKISQQEEAIQEMEENIECLKLEMKNVRILYTFFSPALYSL